MLNKKYKKVYFASTYTEDDVKRITQKVKKFTKNLKKNEAIKFLKEIGLLNKDGTLNEKYYPKQIDDGV